LLERAPPGVTTWTVPLVAPAGTTVPISVGEITLKTAAVPQRDAGRALQIGPENLDRQSRLAEGWRCSHKRAEADGETEDRTATVGEKGSVPPAIVVP